MVGVFFYLPSTNLFLNHYVSPQILGAHDRAHEIFVVCLEFGGYGKIIFSTSSHRLEKSFLLSLSLG